jgi:DNA-binding beta-propeller fold protein YncE
VRIAVVQRWPVVVALIGLLAGFGSWTASAQAGMGPAFRYTLIQQFGKKGNGPGQFPGRTAGPVGIAVNQRCGDIFVSDASKSRVQRFSRKGRFLNYVGTPKGDDVLGIGELEEPSGLDVFIAAGPDNFYGPPSPCSAVTTFTTYVFVADQTGNRLAIFEPSGSWTGSWCNHDDDKQGCDVVKDTVDFYPYDVDATSGRVYVAGRLENTVREYDRAGTYLRKSDPPVDGAFSTAVFGGQLWLTQRYESSVGLFSLDPSNATINRYHSLGSDFSSARGKFTYPQAVATAPNGTLFVLESDRVLVFSPSGIYLTEFTLPAGSDGEDIAVSYDGNLYIADNSSTKPGVLVYSPGPLVTLKLRRAGGRKVRISGRVKLPGHPGRRIRLQRLASNGWRNIKRVRLDSRSRYKHTWHTPRKRTYTVRAFFKDPHRYHAPRTSQYKQIKVR